MRAVLQRVLEANVKVDGESKGVIEKGLVVLVGFNKTDTEKDLQYMLDKIIHLRVFEDEQGKMNLSVKDIEGGILFIPNFTLYGDCRKGRRPSYSTAASVEDASRIFEAFRTMAEKAYPNTAYGQFQADMKVALVNDGPVTLLLDSERNF